MKSILIVEDEDIIAQNIAASLKNLGYNNTYIAESGKKAFKIIEEKQPDLILSDIVLKGKINGIELAHQVQKKYNIPLIYITAYSDEDIINKAKLTGPYGYLTKPFRKKDLKISIDIALYKFRIEQKLRESEKKYRLLLENSVCQILYYDLKGRLVLINKKAAESLGRKIDDLIGKLIDEHFPKPIANSYKQRMKVINESGKGAEFEDLLEFPQGNKWFWSNFQPVKTDDDKTIGVQIISHDITKRKKAEEEIKLLKDLLQAETEYLRKEVKLSHGHKNIIGESNSLKQVLNRAELVAKTQSTVLLLGETGTGKELIAQRIHELSTRKDKTLIKVNCGALPVSLIESELFGKEKGAYTGAMTKQIGYFELADNSTIILDEIGELPHELQVKILRVIQDGQFERLGSPKTIKVNVRIIAVTNCNLEKQVHEGKFRSDLYYRLNVFPITLPPLRKRPEDIPSLTWSFVREFENAFGKKIDIIPRKSMNELQHYSWPGNIRELRNVIEHSMIINQSNKLRIEIPRATEYISSAYLSLEELERHHIIQVLKSTGWRVKGKNGAAEILKLKPTTLYSKIKRLGIKRF